MKLENRTFIVSGGSSGLGLATVLDLTSAGSYVAVIDRNEPGPNTIAPSLSKRVSFHQTDITSLPNIQSSLAAIVSWSKTTSAPIGGVINCAGVASAAKLLDARNGDEPHSLDLWEFVMGVNVTGTFNLTRLVCKHMVDEVKPEESEDGERGVVVMVSSTAAFEGQPGQAAYAASKGAIRSMTLPIARDLSRYNIRVVTIAPGVFESSMTSFLNAKTRMSLETEGILYPKRFGHPGEFAKTVRWILECPYVNGETVRVSGGGRLPGKL